MDAIVDLQAELKPLLENVIEILERERNGEALRFFAKVMDLLEDARTEQDLMVLFGHYLSASAPVALSAGCSLEALRAIDPLLRRAEEIALLFATDTSRRH